MAYIIKLPNGKKANLFYRNTYTDFDRKVELLDDYVFKNWTWFFEKNWEDDRTRSCLDRCANFLLLNESSKGMFMTKYKEDMAKKREIPISNMGSNIQDYFYSNAIEYDATYSDVINKIFDKGKELNISSSKRRKELKKSEREVKSKTTKMLELYPTKKVKTYKLKKTLDENNKIVKNIFGQPVLYPEYMEIGGGKGIIDISKDYITRWAIVDADNLFTFNDCLFRISDSLQQYAVVNKYDESEDYTNESIMDRILCIYFPDSEEYHFYDQNIDKIPNENIELLA